MENLIGKRAKGYSATCQKFVEGYIYHQYSNGVDILTKDGLAFVETGKYEIVSESRK